MSISGKARDNGSQNVQTISRTVNYNDTGIGTADTVKVGTLPASAQIVFASVRVKTAFNAATTNVLTVGTSGGSDADVIADADVDETAAGATVDFRGAGLDFASDTAIYARYTQSGTAATQGQAIIVVGYVSTANG